MAVTGSQTERPKIAAMERGPGPARYKLPSCTGANEADYSKTLYPAYTMGKRLGNSIFKKDFSPGPVHFIDPSVTFRGVDGTPHFSLYSRHKELERFNTPGPGSYVPEKRPPPNEKHAPAFTMGGRTRYRKRDTNPSPNSYSLPVLLGPHIPNRPSSACYSMTGRLTIGGFDTDYAKTPGPARYGAATPDMNAARAPAYSMLSRNFMPGDATKKPGPGAHSPEKCTMTKQGSPSYTLGVRHSEYMCPLIIDVSD